MTAIALPPTKQQFAAAMLDYLPKDGGDGTPVVMGAKGDYFIDCFGHRHELVGAVMVDCSGSVTFKYFQLTGIDLRNTHNAQGLHDACPELLDAAKVEAGDLGFYGLDDRRVGHVVMALAGGRMLSADGATFGRRTPAELARVLSDKSCRVRLYEHVPQLWGDEHFLGFRRNTLFDRFQPKE